MNGIKKILCMALVVVMLFAMSATAFAANGAKDGTGPINQCQQLKDGSGGNGGRGNGGGAKDGTGPLKDGSGGGINCPYLP